MPSFKNGDVALQMQALAFAASAEQYAALQSHQGTAVNFAGTTVDRLLGLLAHTMGNLDQAGAHFDDGLDFCRNAGHRPELAWTCCD